MRAIDQGKRVSMPNGTSVVREQVRAFSADPGPTLAVSVIAAGAVAGTLVTSSVPLWATALWFAAVVLISLQDYRTNANFSDDADAEACRTQLQRNLAIALAAGVAWGGLGWVLFFEPGADYATFLIMVLVGVAGASATLSGGHTRMAMATVVPALLPMALHYAVQGTLVGVAMATSSTAYTLLLYKTVRSRERMLHELIALNGRTSGLADQLQIVADYSYAWEAWLSDDDKLLWVNPSVEQVTGYTPEECYRMVDYPMPIVHPDDREKVARVIASSDRTTSKGDFKSRIVCKDGTIRWIVAEWQPARDTKGSSAGVRVSVRDITETVELQRELERQASTDPLTGLINRRRFLEVCEGETYRAARFGRPVALAIFDLDYFKRVNDTHGHAVGDLCLRAFVGAVKANIRQTDTLARFGGEEFTLLMPETGLEAAAALCERLREAVARASVTTTAARINFTVSIGVTVCDPDETSIDPALARADTALYAAKNKGRNRVRVATSPRMLDSPEAETAARIGRAPGKAAGRKRSARARAV